MTLRKKTETCSDFSKTLSVRYNEDIESANRETPIAIYRQMYKTQFP